VKRHAPLRAVSLGGLALALAVAGLLSPWASPWPDGLERVAERLGFQARASDRPVLAGPLPDYQLPDAGEAGWSTAAAGVIGTLVVFGGTCLLGYALTRRRPGE
jgi:cobalt/nickel transport protein